jgi:alpha-D-ribose 1-methylphosphonate 5-triphosphate diphosphatase
MQTLLYNANLILPDRVIEGGWLLIEEGRIAAIGEAPGYPSTAIVAPRLDLAGNFLLPGLIDLHCDAIEQLVAPRPQVYFDLKLALGEADRRLAACGITTEFHGITLDDHSYGVRSTNFIRELTEVLDTTVTTKNIALMVRHKIHARLELTSSRAFEVIPSLIAAQQVQLLSLMDHGPVHFTSEELYRDYTKRTAHVSDAELDYLVKSKQEQTLHIPERVQFISDLAKEAGLTIASHDDVSATAVDGWHNLGINLIEFPLTLEAATRAYELDLAICMGAPNVVRGKSSGSNLNAMAAIEAGLVKVLCSDYYPPTLLPALFKLAHQKLLTLPQAVRLATLNPAQLVGLAADFGSLAPGKVADIIEVKLNPTLLPEVRRVFVAGQEKMSLSPV